MTASSRTVLIVDDDFLIRDVLRLQLEENGYRVMTAEDGNIALGALAAFAVDAVILDILMPEKEGLETLIDIKRRFPKVPVHVMSGGGARNNFDFLSIAKKFGADSILRKPVPITALLQAINRDRDIAPPVIPIHK